jgi:DNA processing protein
MNNNNNNNNLSHILRLYRSENVGPVTYRLLTDKYGIKNSIEALENMLKEKKNNIPNMESIYKEIEDHTNINSEILYYDHKDFPKDLYDKYGDFPPVLSVLGNKDLLKKNIIGVIGTRLPSLQGLQYTKYICEELGKENYVVLSGFAKGIDTVAHESSLKTGTIALMPCGINIIFPTVNKFLYKEIKDSGLIMTDRPFNQNPISKNFPLRNKLLSFFVDGVVVTEATLQSGTLMTCNFATKINKHIFSVPGHPLDLRYAGNNLLIQKGATLIDNPKTIMQYLKKNLQESSKNIYQTTIINDNVTDKMRENILKIIGFSPLSIENICEYSGYSIGEVNYILLELEILGKLERLINGYVCLINKN